jgi:hypothetical protein
MSHGGLHEAAIRAMIYVMLGEGVADERTFAVLRELRAEHARDMTLPEFKALVRDQFFMLLVDEQRALATLPELAGRVQAEVVDMVGALRRAAMATGELSGQRAARLRRIEALLGVGSTAPDGDATRLVPVAAPSRRRGQSKISRKTIRDAKLITGETAMSTADTASSVRPDGSRN